MDAARKRRITKGAVITAATAAAIAASVAGYKYMKKRGLDKKVKARVQKELARTKKIVAREIAKAKKAVDKAVAKTTKKAPKKRARKRKR